MITSSGAAEEESKDLIWEAEQIGNILMTEGQPTDWNTSNVQSVGLRTNYSIDSNKLLEFKNLSYYRSKTLFGIKSDYFFALKNSDSEYIPINGSYGIGNSIVNSNKTTLDFDNTGADELVQITRLTTFNQNVIRMEIYTWR